MQKGIIKLKKRPCIIASASVVGAHEHRGPLSDSFDMFCEDNLFDTETWEQAESEMQRRAFNLALNKAKMKDCELDAIFAGDLLNQCTGSAYGLCDFDAPYFGLYGACSTLAESLILSSMLVSAGIYEHTAAVVSSHFCSAERQFRYPLEYGNQRTPTAQRTVTGAGAFILSANGEGPFISEVLPGRVVDRGFKDINNMGAAMAPAAIDTLWRYFSESGKSPSDFDLIVTGDLGYEGVNIVRDLLRKHGIELSDNYNDCGLMIYDCERQDVHAGGSGCGCSAVVFAGHLMDRLKRGELREILLVCTGAMMSPGSFLQGLPIPGIAHLLHISAK